MSDSQSRPESSSIPVPRVIYCDLLEGVLVSIDYTANVATAIARRWNRGDAGHEGQGQGRRPGEANIVEHGVCVAGFGNGSGFGNGRVR